MTDQSPTFGEALAIRWALQVEKVNTGFSVRLTLPGGRKCSMIILKEQEKGQLSPAQEFRSLLFTHILDHLQPFADPVQEGHRNLVLIANGRLLEGAAHFETLWGKPIEEWLPNGTLHQIMLHVAATRVIADMWVCVERRLYDLRRGNG